MVVVDEGGGGLWWCGAEGQARLVLRRLAVLAVGGVEQIGGIGNSDGRGPVLNIYYLWIRTDMIQERQGLKAETEV